MPGRPARPCRGAGCPGASRCPCRRPAGPRPGPGAAGDGGRRRTPRCPPRPCGPDAPPAACPAAPRSPARSPPGHRRTTRAPPPPLPTAAVLPSACPPAGSAPHRPDADSASACRRRCFRRRRFWRRARCRARCRAGVVPGCRAGALGISVRRWPGQRARGGRTGSAGVGSSARNGPIGLAGHRDRPEHGGQPAPVAVLHPRPRHAIASGHCRCGASPTGHAHPDAPATAADTAPASGPAAGLPAHRARHPSPPARPATPPPIPDTAGPGRPTPPRRRGGRRRGRPGHGPGRHSRCRQGKMTSRAPGSRSRGFATCRSTRSPPTSRHQRADHTQPGQA